MGDAGGVGSVLEGWCFFDRGGDRDSSVWDRFIFLLGCCADEEAGEGCEGDDAPALLGDARCAADLEA